MAFGFQQIDNILTPSLLEHLNDNRCLIPVIIDGVVGTDQFLHALLDGFKIFGLERPAQFQLAKIALGNRMLQPKDPVGVQLGYRGSQHEGQGTHIGAHTRTAVDIDEFDLFGIV
ncbi:MAG: hypothetical protein BWY72_00144 [Bacteroidetes bacterium ADurb.Bin416]|nr:MAG: hypothetical protein BWY72_00144 [Bacteroidetes bacterium ADurb.Bin416]